MIVAVSYILGVWLASKIDMSATLFTALFLIITFLVRKIIAKKSSIIIVVSAIFFLLGGIRYFGASENGLYREIGEKYVTAVGTVDSMPTASSGKYKFRYTVMADRFTYLDKEYVAKQKLLVYTDKPLEHGDIIKFSGFLNEIEGAKNSNEYDYAKYYKSIGINNRITAKEIEKLGKGMSINPIFWVNKFKCKISTIIDRFFEGNTSALYKAITVGDKTGFSQEYRNLLVRTGVYRVLYANYLHILLILYIVGIFIKNKKDRDYAVMLILVGYAVFNGASATSIKAAALLGVALFRKTIFGFSDKLALLSALVLIMALIDPMLCFNGAFVISIASTVLVYTSYPAINERFSKKFKKRKTANKIKTMLTMWMILLFGTLPISAYFYNSVSVYGIILTYLAVPIILFLILTYPAVLGMYVLFGKAPILESIVTVILKILEKSPYIIEKLPFCYINLKTPSMLEILEFYILWWILIEWVKGEAKTVKVKILIAILCGALIGGINDFNTLSINFVNVGQGDGAVLHTSRGEVVLIDGGGAAPEETKYNVGESVFVPYLISHGFTDIDVAIVTHYHKDHAEGIIAAAKHLKIKTIVMPGATPNDEYRLQLENIASRRNIRIEYLRQNDEIHFKSGLSIKFIAPDEEQLKSDDANDTSLVAEVRYGDFCGIFTGDSTDEISADYPENVDILKASHHGSNTENGREYIEHIAPEFAVISVGEDNSYGLPDTETLERLKAVGAKILRTDELGDIQFKINKNGKMTYSTFYGGI